MSMGVFMPLVAGGGKAKASIEFLKAQKYGNSTSFTLSNIVVPKAGLLIVGAAWRTIGFATSFGNISIGGSVGTKNVSTPPSLAGACIASREVSAGTHSVVAPAASGNFAYGGALCAWLLTDYGDPAPHHIATQTGYGSSSSVSLNVPPNGVAVFAHTHDNTDAASWSSAEEVAQLNLNYDITAFADLTLPAGASPHTETVTWASLAVASTAVASWA